jgi:hypothetical protein
MLSTMMARRLFLGANLDPAVRWLRHRLSDCWSWCCSSQDSSWQTARPESASR